MIENQLWRPIAASLELSHYGILFPDDELAYPRYRRLNTELVPDKPQSKDREKFHTLG